LRRLWIGVLFLMGGSTLSAAALDPGLYAELRWRLIGPFRGGRTVAVAGVPGEPSVYYMAAVNGGVWKSTDFGEVWRPIFDGAPTGSVGALAIAPSNPEVLYVGSGEGLRRPDLSVGNGIYKSTDAGKTWEHLGLRNGFQINALLVDPSDANRVFAAVMGHPYGPNKERGVYRSLDGGKTWLQVLFKDENTGAIDLAFDPQNPQIVYASLWASRRPPWTTGGGLSLDGGLFKSTDGGTNWTQLKGGLPSEHVGRIGIGVAPSDPRRIYLWVQGGSATGIYRSKDAGATWERVNSEERVTSRGDDFSGVRVDPKDPETLYVANTSTYRSKDGGKTFTAIKGAPGGDDYHTIWINPKDPRIILLGCDQGATLSVNGGETWSSWYNQPTAQFYHVATDNRFPYWVYGGQQESGSIGIASRSDNGILTFRDWHTVGLEEYGYAAPDPLDPNIVYGGKLTRFNHVTGQVQDISPAPIRSDKFRFNRTAPVVFSPVDPHVLYYASQVLFATRDGGASWSTLSPDLTREDPGVPGTLGPFAELSPGPHRGVIYTIAPSPRDVNLIWVGTDDGLIHVTKNGGKDWKNVTPPNLTPWSKVSILEASHFDSETAYAAINRFRLDDMKPHVLRTRDGGATWLEVTQGLPQDEPVNVVREDPVRKGLLYAGTEGSVFVSFDDGDNWQSLQLNLPHTSMRDLVIHGDDLVLGTHGRSFWILDDVLPLRQAKTGIPEVHLFDPAEAIRIQRDQNTDTPLPPEVPAGQNPPDGAPIDYYLRERQIGVVTVEILDEAGHLVRRFQSNERPAPPENDLNVPTYWVRPPRILSDLPGMHRFVWDLRYPPPPALEHEYPISAVYRDTPKGPLGPSVLPGRYTVKLTAGGVSRTALLTVKMDPRVKTDGLQAQFDLSIKVTDALEKDFAALEEVRGYQRAAQKLDPSLGEPLNAFKNALDELDPKAEARGRPRKGLASLNRDLVTLLTFIDGADAAPTTQQAAAVDDATKALDDLLSRFREVKGKELKALNTKLGGKGPLAPSKDPQRN
jgi:photosystem II stability/assembly factor-like uncharacterized protein